MSQQDAELYDSATPEGPDSLRVFVYLLCKYNIPYERKSIPAPRLVGIETNPGPNPKGLDALVRRNMERLAQAHKKKMNKKSKRSRTPRILDVVSRVSTANPDQYARTFASALIDPWEAGPMKLGFNCFTETVLATAYLRSSFVVNADGTFALVLVPSATGMVLSNISGSAGVTWVQSDASNRAAVLVQGTEGRVTSGGIRLFALFPETSAPGVLFGGLIPTTNVSLLTAMAPVSFTTLSSAEVGIGSKGARAVLLPQDPDSYVFSTPTVTGYTTTVPITSSIPFITGTSFPVGTVIWYEAVLNLELLPSVSSGSVGAMPLSSSSDVASTHFPTPLGLWNAARPYLTSSVVMDATQGLLSMAAPRIARALGSSFGGGAGFRRALVAGEQVLHQNRRSTIMLEEMKDGELI
jgi:hypothetical protein